MTAHEAIAPIVPLSKDAIVITTMSSVADWPADASSPLVFHYIPSSMGQGPALGLGLALAQPGRRVIVLNGDGCMLMNLGSLATIAACAPKNLAIVVLDNGQYEVTGGQPHGGAGRIDFSAVARGAGIATTFEFSSAADWASQAATTLTQPGPIVVTLKVQPRPGQSTPKPRRPMAEQIECLRTTLGIY